MEQAEGEEGEGLHLETSTHFYTEKEKVCTMKVVKEVRIMITMGVPWLLIKSYF